jgi:hypothetical protein
MNSDTRILVLEYARLALEEKLKYDESLVPGAVPRKERMQQIIDEMGAAHEEILRQASQIMEPVE